MSKMTKIIQLNAVVNTGSTGRIAEEIGKLIIRQNWDSYIAFGRTPQKSQSKLLPIGYIWNTNFHAIQTRIFDNHGFASKKATQQLIAQIEEIKPAIIHLHNIHGYYLHVGLLFNYLKITNIPVVWTLHDCWAFTGHCAYYDYIGCEKWKTQCYNCPQKKSYPTSWLLDSSRNNYNGKKNLFTSLPNLTIVTPSVWLADQVKQSFLSNFPIKVTNNGIDLNLFKEQSINRINDFRNKFKIEGKFIILGVASTWDARKGFKDFIHLSGRLSNEYVIFLVGLNNKQMKNLPYNIIGLKRTENIAELALIYSSADVFVNPTKEDNFPTTNLEALACGTPIITYNTGGSVESVTEKCGIIVNKGDINGLYSAINKIKSNGKEYYKKECKSSAKLQYNKNDRFMDYINLYKELLENKGNVQK